MNVVQSATVLARISPRSRALPRLTFAADRRSIRLTCEGKSNAAAYRYRAETGFGPDVHHHGLDAQGHIRVRSPRSGGVFPLGFRGSDHSGLAGCAWGFEDRAKGEIQAGPFLARVYRNSCDGAVLCKPGPVAPARGYGHRFCRSFVDRDLRSHVPGRTRGGFPPCLGRAGFGWGADHHGYIVRIKAAAEALGFDPERLTIRLVQFAILYKEGALLQMSTRSGSFVTLRELREDVGRDACRYFYVMRKADQHLDFDLSLATSQTKDNPVYYVQYAHARICRVLEGLNEIPFDASRGLNHLTELTTQDVLDLATAVGRFPEVVAKASDSLEAHLICYYLQELAADFHRWYNGTRLLVDDLQVRDARLALATAVQIVIRNGLDLLGVCAPRSM